MITIDFKEEVDGKFVSKSTYAKVARGTMAHLILKNKIRDLKQIKDIEFDSYRYNVNLSSNTHFVFTR